MTHPQPQPLDLDAIRSAVADTFDQFEPTETRQTRWEAAALAAGREVDRNALRAYMAVADAERQALADAWAKSAAAADAEIRRLRTDDPHAEIAKLIRWHGEDETAMTEMRATITRLRTELAAANSRLAEPGRPDVEARCGCPHPEGEHSVYGCADGCGCEWMPKRPPMDPVHILGIKPDEATPADPQPVHHAPGIVIRCADCRAKGHTVCMDDAVSQPKGAGL